MRGALHNDIRSLLLAARDKGIKDEQIVVTLTCQKVKTGGEPHAN